MRIHWIFWCITSQRLSIQNVAPSHGRNLNEQFWDPQFWGVGIRSCANRKPTHDFPIHLNTKFLLYLPPFGRNSNAKLWYPLFDPVVWGVDLGGREWFQSKSRPYIPIRLLGLYIGLSSTVWPQRGRWETERTIWIGRQCYNIGGLIIVDTGSNNCWVTRPIHVVDEQMIDRIAYNTLLNQSINQSINQNPWRPGVVGVPPTDASAVTVVHRRLSSATRSNDDTD